LEEWSKTLERITAPGATTTSAEATHERANRRDSSSILSQEVISVNEARMKREERMSFTHGIKSVPKAWLLSLLRRKQHL
jgi:hypothetical protein